MLMEDHLRASGLHASADMLTQEAGLPRLPADGQARLPVDAAPDLRNVTEQQSTPFYALSSQRDCPLSTTQPSRGEGDCTLISVRNYDMAHACWIRAIRKDFMACNHNSLALEANKWHLTQVLASQAKSGDHCPLHPVCSVSSQRLPAAQTDSLP